MAQELKDCAEESAQLDMRMDALRKRVFQQSMDGTTSDALMTNHELPPQT